MRADNLEWLSHLSSMLDLYLSNVNFTKAEDWFQRIMVHPSLSVLLLSFCEFPQIITSAASSINASNSISALILYYNTFDTPILSWLFNLSTGLVQLQAFDDGPKGPIPDSIGDMIWLESLDLSNNFIEGGIPSSFRNLCRLKDLDLRHNALNATLDDILQSLSCAKKSLEILYLSDNQLTGSISDISEFESLIELDVSHNRLTGTLPNFDNLSSRVRFFIRNNSLSGGLPRSVSKLSNITYFDVSSNSLHGIVSEEHLSTLSKLQELGLSDNNFTFITSSNWVPPFQLHTIKLGSCNLGPHFPRWLQTQEKLTWLDISNSEISDAMPTWIWNLSSGITFLNLSSNHIHGKIPNFPLQFSNFPGIDLSSNLLHGPIPQFLSHTASLNLAENNFSGTLSFLCSANATTDDDNLMIFLDLSDNQLTGHLPDCWMNLRSLSIINLEANNLFGAVPSSIGSLDMLETLRLSRNNFTDHLPSTMQNCTNLIFLDVGENKLSGHVPAWIGENLEYLVVLRLRSNQFYGNVPSKICLLESLQILDLAINNISGHIPTCHNNLTAMLSTELLETTISHEYYKLADYSSFTNDLSYDASTKSTYLDYTYIIWKGFEREYGKTLGLLRIINLSSNNLTGAIPSEATELLGLKSLHLSRNYLSGIIPEDIGQLQKLEVLDLSHNKISGEIPSSLAGITFLNMLDLSDNNLTGRIPTSRQLQSFGASAYKSNVGLCGCPLLIKCPGGSTECLDDRRRQEPTTPVTIINTDENDGFFDRSSLYAGMGVGFAVGLSGFCCFLIMTDSWRHAYFGFLNRMGEALYLFVALKIVKRCNAARLTYHVNKMLLHAIIYQCYLLTLLFLVL